MEIIYKDEKDFTKENIIELFLSVDWQLSATIIVRADDTAHSFLTTHRLGKM